MAKIKNVWRGDIKVSGHIPFDVKKLQRFFGGTEQEAKDKIEFEREDGKTSVFQESYCGSRATPASHEVRRFLAIGVIPTIEGELNL